MVWFQVREAAAGLKYLHDNKVVHGDVKPVSTPHAHIHLDFWF
jgi:serine/threonine protein kinase